jgi:lipid A disaccharide synthetase
VIWWLVVIWLVVVGIPTVYVGVRGIATMRRANALQLEVQTQLAAMQTGGLATLATRQAELQQNLERLTTVMNRLNTSLDNLRMLIDRWKSAIAPLRLVLRILRG